MQPAAVSMPAALCIKIIRRYLFQLASAHRQWNVLAYPHANSCANMMCDQRRAIGDVCVYAVKVSATVNVIGFCVPFAKRL